MDPEGEVTRLLGEAGRGDRAALDRLYQLVYAELRRIAARNLRQERPGHTLQPTALVSEAYLRMAPSDAPWENRRHFFGAAAEAMRRILVDHARRVHAEKRGSGAERVSLPLDLADPAADEALALVEIDEALATLGTVEPRLAELVSLRYFAGLSVEQTAEALGVSPATVKRDWVFARAWLLRHMGNAADDPT